MEISSIPNRIFTSVKSFITDSFANRFWDWQSVVLVIVLVQISSARLTATDWAPFLYFTQTISLLGTILGLVLGYSTFNRRATIYAVLAYSALLLPVQWLNAAERSDQLSKDLLLLAARIFTSLALFLKNEPVYDPLFFVVIVSIGFWIVGLWAGYHLIRHRDFLDAVLPAGLAMLIVQLFDPYKTLLSWGLGLYIFVALLLLGRLYFLENQKNLKKSRALVTPETIRDVMNGVVVSAFVVVVFAWSLPNLISGVEPATRAWDRITRPFFTRLSDATKALEVNNPYGPGNKGDLYGTDIFLGQKTSQGDVPVFYVKQDEGTFVPPRYYWRGRVYGLYVNGRWTNSTSRVDAFAPSSAPLKVENPDDKYEVKLSITSNLDSQGLIYAPAGVVWLNQKSKVVSIPYNNIVSKDVTAWLMDDRISKGDKYQVSVLMSDPTVEELRAADTVYPAWVTEKYLQVPENIAPRLRNLTESITAPYTTTYDKTMAVTNYLRKEIEYSSQLEAVPPQNADPVMWVLFESKKGFCMYYASAEVLMLRSIGIPARFAVGFAEGAYDDEEERFVVTHADSHAWPEVYFPGIGWVEFEPTGNQDPLERRETNVEPAGGHVRPPSVQPEDSLQDKNQSDSQNGNLSVLHGTSKASLKPDKKIFFLRYIVPPLALVLSGVLIFFLQKRFGLSRLIPSYLAGRYTHGDNALPTWMKNWTRWASLSDVEKSFQAINLSLYWLKHPQAIHMPSAQRAQLLIKHLPEAENDINILLNEYQASLYTQRRGNFRLARKAALQIVLRAWRKRYLRT